MMTKKVFYKNGIFNATSGLYSSLRGRLLERLIGKDLVIANMHWKDGELDIDTAHHIFTFNSELPAVIIHPIQRLIQSEMNAQIKK